MQEKPKVIVLMGGSSAERDISIKTGTEIYEALKSKGYQSETIDMSSDIVEDLRSADGDLVFIALHGSPGEDGTIQGLLDTLEIPYVGSGVLASALGMDKYRSKLFFAALGIPSPFYMLIYKKELEKSSLEQMSDKLIDSIGLPLVIKPVREGSAIGVTIVKEKEKVKVEEKEQVKVEEKEKVKVEKKEKVKVEKKEKVKVEEKEKEKVEEKEKVKVEEKAEEVEVKVETKKTVKKKPGKKKAPKKK